MFTKVTALTEMNEYILAKHLNIFDYLGTVVLNI